MATTEVRCSGCGEVLRDGDSTVCINTGTFRKGSHKPGHDWGVMHRPCFNRSIDSPEATLEEIHRLSDSVDE